MQKPRSAKVALLLLCWVIVIFSLLNRPAEVCIVKLYYEPTKNAKTLSYFIESNSEAQLSYYIGSDLPRWKTWTNKNYQGNFRAGDLVNLRFSTKKNKPEVNAILTIFNDNGIIWKGKLICDGKKNLSIVNQSKNETKYKTEIKIDKPNHIIWLELEEKQ